MPDEVIREMVSELRQQRLRGAGGAELVHFIESFDFDEYDAGRCMKEAFCLKQTPNMRLLQRDRSGAILDSALDGAFGRAIDEARDVWTTAGPYPDLIRRRDRHAFKEVARDLGLIIFVRAASPSIERYVGKVGYRPRPIWLEGTARSAEPNAGLIAADPEDAGLIRLLQQSEPPRTYAAYQHELERNGFAITSAAGGYVVRDRMGTAFYPGYCLHSVYSASTGMNAWTAADGDRIRAALNLRLGEELIQCGPFELWDQGAEAEPQFPLLMFHAQGAAYVIWNAGELRAEYNFRKIVQQPRLTDSSPSLAGSK